MKLKSISLANFRNYENELILPADGMNVIVGQNAQGKTNIIEAIYLCCVGRSHRTSRDEELISWDKPYCRVAVSSYQNDGTHDVSIYISKSEKKKKQIKISNKKADRIGELFGHVCGVLFSPEDLQIIKGGPSERRRFLDMMLSQLNPNYFYSLQKYSKTLAQRNALLREIATKPYLSDMLDPWDDILAQCGSYIAEERMKAIQKLSEIAEEEHRYLTGEKEILSLSYISGTKDAENIKEKFSASLKKGREEDIKRQMTGFGIHRDDIGIKINEKMTRIYGSQGQQRSAVLSLKLSQIDYFREEKGEDPVLLLDDVMSELDPSRRIRLSERIDRIQTFVTCTDLSDLSGAGIGNIFEIENGKIKNN